MKTIRMKIKDGSFEAYFDMPIQIEKEIFFGFIKIVRAKSEQSSVYGRKKHYVFFWEIKNK